MKMQSDLAAGAVGGIRLAENGEGTLYHRGKVAQVVEIANRSPRRPAILGDFSIAPLREEYDKAGYVQIRAVPTVDRGGLEFRFHLRAMGDIDIDAEECATQLLDAARQFEQATDTPDASGIRAAVEFVIAPATQVLSPLRITAIGLCPTGAAGHYAITIDLETLGDDLTNEIARVIGWDLAEAQRELAKLADRHLQRDQLRCQALASGAIGWIDGTAHRILEMSGLPLADAVSILNRKQPLEFEFEKPDKKEFEASFYWIEGVIYADLQALDDEWSFSADCLSIKHPRHPEAVIMAWVGHRIGEIFEQDFIPADAMIVGVSDVPGGWLDIELAIPTVPIAVQQEQLPQPSAVPA